MRVTKDINVLSSNRLAPPREIHGRLPMTEKANETVANGREEIQAILEGRDERLLIVAGPCSIHDKRAAFEYAERLAALARELQDRLRVVMRVYFEKPRTIMGWKGLINDPRLDGTFDIEAGLALAREIMLAIAEMGLPAGTEMLDPITPQYLADLVSWGSIGARTTESQTHRQMASGLSMPVGFKNATDGNLEPALNAMEAARQPHYFLGIDYDGHTCVIHTKGNPWGHLILRGGYNGPNYHDEDVEEAAARLLAAHLPPAIMMDCSHANSKKDFHRQGRVWKDALRQRREGARSIIGLMIESNLIEGQQKLASDPGRLKYGVSITDGCIGWEETEDLLRQAHRIMAP
ncbi:MAG: 3-deoxy-7-phosphoheptulonate synthase [Candidatus Sumerlaeota bacterium]|nr:3-deoxy-7-phosphoheptulonate synthase [Candidatus Sumerlaeota bacterium]